MRRCARAGVSQGDLNRIVNERFWADPRCAPDAKGWVQPFALWQGWDEWNQAAYALRCAIIWRGMQKRLGGPERDPWYYSGLARIESDLRTVRFSLARSARCDRPALP